MIRPENLPDTLPLAMQVLERPQFADESELLDALESLLMLLEVSIRESATFRESVPMSMRSDPVDDPAMFATVRSLIASPEFLTAISSDRRPPSEHLAAGSPLPHRNVPMADRGITQPVVGGPLRSGMPPLSTADVLDDLPPDLIPPKFQAWFAVARFAGQAAIKLIRHWKSRRNPEGLSG